MARNGGKDCLLMTRSLDPPIPIKGKTDTTKRRKIRRCRSAPPAEYLPNEKFNIGSVPHCDSIFANLHPSLRKVSIYLAIYLGVGTLCFCYASNQIKGEKTNGIVDAVYFCIVTMTTVGYGDLVPNSILTKLLACAFVFSGMALVGLILSEAADYLVEKQEVVLAKALHSKEGSSSIESVKEIETNKEKYKCVMLFLIVLLLMILGTTFLVTIEKLDLIDAFYCVCSTITTLGYGDKSFSTSFGRIFAVFWILTSTICLAQLFLYIAEVKTENRRRPFVKWVLNRRWTHSDLEAADLDDDGVVVAAEFVIYKLKEMGKIRQEDISVVMQEFEKLDIDNSGTLTATDIALAQWSQIER